MAVESAPKETRVPVQPGDMIPAEANGQGTDMSPDDNTMSGFRARAQHVPPCMRFAIFTIVLLIILISFASLNPLYSLMFAFLAILPAGIVAKFIMTRFKDDAVSEKFLVNQFLVGAIPLSIAVILVELLFGVILLLAVFSHELATFDDAHEQSSLNGTIPANTTALGNTTTTSGGSQPTSTVRIREWKPTLVGLGTGGKAFPENMTDIAPLWKIILFLLLNAFIVASLVEETGKWVVSRRYLKINSEPANEEDGRTVGCRGILAVCSMGALGFATIENLGYVLGLTTIRSDGFPFALVALALLRGVLAFPVHVGAQFYVGISAAQKYIFNDDARILYALFIAIIFHGTFDAAALVVGLFVSKEWWPDWVMAIVVAFQLCLVAVLMILCRGRYTALLERERVVLPSQDEV